MSVGSEELSTPDHQSIETLKSTEDIEVYNGSISDVSDFIEDTSNCFVDANGITDFELLKSTMKKTIEDIRKEFADSKLTNLSKNKQKNLEIYKELRKQFIKLQDMSKKQSKAIVQKTSTIDKEIKILNKELREFNSDKTSQDKK